MNLTRRTALAMGTAAITSLPLAAASREKALFIPGYDEAKAVIDGVSARDHPHVARALPEGYRGEATLLTRIGLETGQIDHAVLPVQGHVAAVDRNTGIGVLHAQGRDWSVAFDSETLDLISVSLPFSGGFTGGGHVLFIDDARHILTVERAPYGPYLGAPEKHFGRVSIREAESLKVIHQISSHGIAPHDLDLTPDGKTLVVANYGSPAPISCRRAEQGYVVEPSLTFVDLDSGRLLDKIVIDPASSELRHFAMADRDRLLAVQVQQRSRSDHNAPADLTEVRGCAYLPAPLVSLDHVTKGAPPSLVEAASPALMRHGLSIAHDALHDQYIATFPSSHAVHVIDGSGGDVLLSIDTRTIGLPYPSGLALDPSNGRYFVAGAFGPIQALSLSSHEPLPEGRIEIELFKHSHIVLA